MIKCLIRLYILYFGAMLAVLGGMYFPGLDLFLCIAFLALMALEAREQAAWLPFWHQRLGVALIWQMPGFALIFGDVLYLQQYWDWIWYAKFTLELWDLPLLPLLSLIPSSPSWHTPLYYYALFIVVPLQCILYLLSQAGVQIKYEAEL